MSSLSSFTYNVSPARVVFGQGASQKLPDEMARQNLKLPLVLSTPDQRHLATEVETILLGNIAGIFDQAVIHTPMVVTDKAMEYLKTINADSVISIGGGTTIGLGKAISVRTGLPHICIPTTYAGSEMTPILGETCDGQKRTRSDPTILPGTVIYDVKYTLTLPTALSVTSGINAIAHAVEALYSQDTNPIINLLSLEAIKALVESLPAIVNSPNDIDARLKAQYGAWLCGISLGSVGMSLHHKLCHTLGGSFNMPHSETHTIVLPHALAYNAPAIPNVMAQLATTFPNSNGDAVHGLNLFLDSLNVRKDLGGLGFQEGDVDRAADIAVLNAYKNPRPIERNLIREIIRRAYAGEEARADL